MTRNYTNIRYTSGDSASTELDFTMARSLPKGTVLQLKDDGTVDKIGGNQIPTNLSDFVPPQVNTLSNELLGVTRTDPNDNNRIVRIWSRSNAGVYACIGRKNGNSITWGSEFLFSTNDIENEADNLDFQFVTGQQNRIMVILGKYSYGPWNLKPTVYLTDIDNDIFSIIDTETFGDTYAPSSVRIAFDSEGTFLALAPYGAKVMWMAGKVENDIISIHKRSAGMNSGGMPYNSQFNHLDRYPFQIEADPAHTGRFLAYAMYGDDPWILLWNVEGYNQVTYYNAHAIASNSLPNWMVNYGPNQTTGKAWVNSGGYDIAFNPANPLEVAVVFSMHNVGGSSTLYSLAIATGTIDYSNWTITWNVGSQTELYRGSHSTLGGGLKVASIAFTESGQSLAVVVSNRVFKYDMNNTTAPQLGYTTSLSHEYYAMSSLRLLGNGKFAFANNGTYQEFQFEHTVPGVAIDKTKIVGILAADAVSGATAKVTPIGGASTSLSGLTTNTDYYVSEFGELTTTKTESSVKIGKALSGTTLLQMSSSDSLTTADIDARFATVVDAAPAALDTLNKLAAAIGDNANFAGTVTTQLADKADITYVNAQIADKADITYVDAQIASSIPSWETVTTNTTLVSGTRYIVDTSSTSVQLTLPSSPSIGDEVRLIDGTGNAATNNIILASTANIQGSTDDLTITTNRAAFAVVYFDSTNGWLLMEI